MAQPAPLLLHVLTAWLVCCLCLAPAVRGQTDPYGTVTFAGRGSAQSAAAVASLASSYRFVTTAVRNNFAGSSDMDALTAVGNGSAAYAVIDDLQASVMPSGTVAVPLLGAALVLPYNLNSLGSASVSTLTQLVKLDMQTIGLIFAGNITHWNDSQILALNTNATYSYWAELAASSSAITVVVRADATPTTRAFTRALANSSTAFADVVGVSDLPAWPASFVQATGASGVMTAVLNTPGAIGFIDLPSWTATSGVPYASIRNQNKQNVLPTIANVQRLMADNAKSFKASASMVANLVDGNNAATWPLGWMNYLVTPTGNFSSCDVPAAVFEWYGWIEYNAQAVSAMSASNYATLHYSVLKRATDALGQVKCNKLRSIPTSVLSGSGATLPLITYQAWIQEYFTNVDPNVALSYTGTGSSTGISDIVNYNTDLGASDAALGQVAAGMEEVARLDDVYRGGFIGEEEYLRRRLLLLHVSRDDAGGANPPAAGGNHPKWCDSPLTHPQPPADHTPGMPPRNRHDHDGHGPEWAITTTTSAERGLRGDWATTTLVMVDEERERALYDAGLEAKEWGHQRQTVERARSSSGSCRAGGRREAAVLTPSWRLLDEESEDDEETWEGDDGNDEDDEEEEEDTDDEAYERRHKPYERGEVAAGLLEMTMAELRELLRQRGLPQSGVKTDLALRLAQFFVP